MVLKQSRLKGLCSISYHSLRGGSMQCVLSCFSHVCLSAILWTVACQAPLSMQFSNTGVGCHALLQGIFLTKRSNPRLSYLWHWQAVLYH